MSAPSAVSQWIQKLQEGDAEAAQKLWEGYFRRLVGLARVRLRDLPRTAADEEDVALSAFDSFCRGAEQGRFPRLDDRHDLWNILVTITARKASDLREREERDRRDWRRSQPLAGSGPPDREAKGPLLLSREPDPAFAAQVAEECQRLLGALPDEQLRQIALRKMEGHTNDEIATLLDLAPATVERRLRFIRRCWDSEAPA